MEVHGLGVSENIVSRGDWLGKPANFKGACLVGRSLRSKRFRAVSEQRKTEERDSRFWPREK